MFYRRMAEETGPKLPGGNWPARREDDRRKSREAGFDHHPKPVAPAWRERLLTELQADMA
jgi:hypothetical protein